MSENGWKKIESELVVRKGMKSGWLEMVFKRKDGVEVKMIGKVVKEFYSERSGVEEL